MRYDDIEARVRERDGERVVEVDGYFRPHPESKPPEYERKAVLDLTPGQARRLHEDLEECLTRVE